MIAAFQQITESVITSILPFVQVGSTGKRSGTLDGVRNLIQSVDTLIWTANEEVCMGPSVNKASFTNYILLEDSRYGPLEMGFQ